jgi:hypothetical protein
MVSKYPVIIHFVENDTTTFWKTSVTGSERSILNFEVRRYESQCDDLLSGRAPEASYQDKEIADRLLMTEQGSMYREHPAMTEDLERDWTHAAFHLVRIDEPSKEADEFREGKYKQGEVKDLIDLLTKPYCPGKFSLGYRVLPLTQLLIDSNRFE